MQMAMEVTITCIFFFVGCLSFVVVARVIYLRSRRKGYRPPGAALILVTSIVAGLFASFLATSLSSAQHWFLSAVGFLLALIIGAGLVGAILLWLLPRRNPRTFGSRHPRFPFTLAAILVNGLTIALFISALILTLHGKGQPNLLDKAINSFIAGIAIGGYFIYLGRRAAAPVSLEEIKERDPRKPVLYLRPFAQEQQHFLIASAYEYGKYAHGLQRFESSSTVLLRFEEFFDDAIHSLIGPFFALGNPEDYTPPEGAIRAYATDDEWEDYLGRIVKKCSCIVAELASSDNLRWELEYLRSHRFQRKLFILTPPAIRCGIWSRFFALTFRLSGIPAATWDSFSALLSACGYQSCSDPGNGAVITFNTDGRAMVLTTGAKFPEEYVEPIRSKLIEKLRHSPLEFEPPSSESASTAADRDRGFILKLLRSGWLWGAIVAFSLVMSFREYIPVLRDVAIRGNSDLRTALHLSDAGHYAEAIPYFERSVAAGNERAMTDLALSYEQGQGVAKDEAKAVSLYNEAVGKGESQAMVNLGIMYLQGRGGLGKSETSALDLFRRAAGADNTNGMLMLGIMYEHGGHNLAQDSAQAISWYRKAANGGNKAAKERLRKLESHAESAK